MHFFLFRWMIKSLVLSLLSFSSFNQRVQGNRYISTLILQVCTSRLKQFESSEFLFFHHKLIDRASGKELSPQQTCDVTCQIKLNVFCPGGSVTAGLGIYDTMQYIRPPVATWCVGQACSMGSFLLASGTDGMRHSLPNSRIMIHQPLGGAQV